MTPTLFSFRRCPYAIRARMALALANIEYNTIEVDLKNKPKELLELSPKGTVPVLVIGDRVIDESLDIVVWALDRAHSKNWLTCLSDPDIQGLLEKLNQSFIQPLNRYKYPNRYDNVNTDLELIKVQEYLNNLNLQLDNQAFLFQESPSAADLLIFPLVRQLVIANPHSLDLYPQLQSWLNYWLSTASFQKIMQKETPSHTD
ncbi:MAG TPA: glutathione S-transferase N-terminal domain-containing protein [Gammaproteobacteria bacterium]|nr:glutathione S-transferase N-terminal domain-containing protein [Gammaproteobacteria bacterium]